MANALRAINKRVNQLQKQHPNKKRKTLQKQAGREWKAGTMPKARKKAAKKKATVSGKRKYKVTHRVKKVGAVKRKKRTVRRKAKRATVRVIRRTKTKTKYRRVGAAGGSAMKMLLPLALVAGVGILAYMAFSKDSTTVPPLTLTGNAPRDNSAQSILAYATAAGMGISAITALINALNSMNDSQVSTTASLVSNGSLDVGEIAPPTGGPSIHLG